GRGRLEREDLELVLRQADERFAVEERATAPRRGPLFAAPEVVHVPEEDVVHRVAVGNGDRDGEERDAALRVERAVDRVDDEGPPAGAADARLLADDADVLAAKAFDDHPRRGGIDRCRFVPALARTHDRLALGATRQL